MKLDKRFSIGWLVVGIAALGLEVIALKRDERGDTLSEHVWFALRMHPLAWLGAAAFFAWLIPHFLGFGVW